MKTLLAVVSVASLGVATHLVAAEIPGTGFSHGNWQGAAYTFSDSSQFSHCAISVGYVSGDTLYFGVNNDATVTVGVASPNFRLRPPEEFPVTVSVDRRQPFRTTARAVDETFAVLTIPDFQRAMDAFGRGRTLTVESDLGSGSYDLTGSFRALEMARQCAIEQLQREAANPPQNAPPAPPPPSGTLPPPSGTTGN